MGAWGVGSFDNDTAGDWADGFEEVEDLSLVHEALAKVLDSDDEYLEAEEACEALAACEVIARLKGNWGRRDAYSATVDQWVEAHPQRVPGKLVKRAVAVIDRVLTNPSELLELWEEGADASAWRRSVEDLRARVKA